MKRTMWGEIVFRFYSWYIDRFGTVIVEYTYDKE